MRTTTLKCDECGKKIGEQDVYVATTSSLVDPGGTYEPALVEKHYHLEHAPEELGVEAKELVA